MSANDPPLRPAAQTLPHYLADRGQNGSTPDEEHRLSPQDVEGASVPGQLRGRVLLVDDEPLVRKFISRHLVAAGYVVRAAVDGLDAIAKLRAGPLDVIISDLNMPGMAGFEFLEVVRTRFPQIPVIAVSAVADELPEGLPADAFFPKNEFLYQRLFETIPALTSSSHPRNASPPVDNEPVQARWEGVGHCIVRCQDCLREFAVPRVFRMGRDEAWTTCAHCASFVRFLVAEQSDNK